MNHPKTDSNGVIRLPVTLRSPAMLARASIFCAPVRMASRRKLRGGWRILYKFYLALYRLFFCTLRIPLPGKVVLKLPDGDREVPVGLANPMYLLLPVAGEAFIFEPRVTAFIDYLAPKLSVVYDVGSNWGYYVSLLATSPEFRGRVHAFEITPRAFRELEGIVEGLGDAAGDRIFCHQVGLSDSDATVAVKEYFFSGMNAVVPAGQGDLRLQVRKLDDMGLEDPDLIKIDVEGHEASVLDGARATLARARPVVVFENWYSPDPDIMLEPLRILAEEGYRLYHPAWEVSAGSRGAYVNRIGTREAQQETLCLLPFLPDARPLMSGAANLIAVHPDRLETFFPDAVRAGTAIPEIAG